MFVVSDDDPLLDYAGIRDLTTQLGTPLTRPSLRAYRATGRMPDPDDLSVSDRPRWRRSTITTWLANRPGRGYRSDKHGLPPAG